MSISKTKPNKSVVGCVEVLSPTDCASMLEKNEHNRPLRAVNVTYFAKQMENGKWELNGEPIIIARNGDIMDGQHRLWACIECGIPLTVYVVRGVDMDTFHTLDTGSKRSTGSGEHR